MNRPHADLVDLMNARYPDAPGYKARETSKAAADSMRDRAPSLRDRVLAHIKGCGLNGATADECAAAMGESVLAVRPRVTELNATGLIVETRYRRKNDSGRLAIVWTA